MKQGRTILAGLLTAAVVLTGFFLPNLVASAQARNAQTVQVETGPAQLFFSSSLSLREKLTLMSSGASYVQSVEVGTARHLAQEDAERLAQSYAQGFSTAAMKSVAVEPMNAIAYYNMFSDSGKAFYIWECYFLASDGGLVLVCIDDETGYLLQLSWEVKTSGEFPWGKRIVDAQNYLMDVCAQALDAVFEGSYAGESGENMAAAAVDEMGGQVLYCQMYEPVTDESFDIPIWYNEIGFHFNELP